MSKNTPTSYADFVYRGPRIKVGNKTYQKKVGAVAVNISGSNLNVGWSLCNNKAGDRFDQEHAMALAEGRAKLQHNNSVKCGKNQVPTTSEMMRKGVPQSCLSTMSALISRALKDHPEVRRVVIYNTKTERTMPTPQLMW